MQLTNPIRHSAILTSTLLCVVFVGLQFVSTPAMPKTSASAAPAALAIDPQVGAIFDRSCHDCHSSRTKWPWYSHVAPVSWIVSKDVSKARGMLNFSEWADAPGDRRLICDAVSSREMPLPMYTLMHQGAKLSQQDVDLICKWAGRPSQQ